MAREKHIFKEINIVPEKQQSIGITEGFSQNKYRYSIGYFNSIYDKTTRVEVIFNNKQSERDMERALRLFLNLESKEKKGVRKLLDKSTFIGFEAEEIGTNDMIGLKTNKFYFTIS